MDEEKLKTHSTGETQLTHIRLKLEINIYAINIPRIDLKSADLAESC